jgi:hypothetical protein
MMHLKVSTVGIALAYFHIIEVRKLDKNLLENTTG